MGGYIIRRLAQSVVTILSVMVLTFLLFRGIAGDIASAHVGQRATEQQKADWRHIHGYDLPMLANLHGRVLLVDRTTGPNPLSVKDAGGTKIAEPLALILVDDSGETDPNGAGLQVLAGRYVFGLARETAIGELTGDAPLALRQGDAAEKPGAVLRITLSDAAVFDVDLSNVKTCGDLMDRINSHPDNHERLEAKLPDRQVAAFFDSQFFHHLKNSATFQSRSLKTNEKLTDIITERAPKSLALTIPALVLGWVMAMIVACFVAYYRDSWIDRFGVLLSVLGMCVPFLAFMILGQWLMFELAPRYAFGLASTGNIYVPIAIMVIAGLGGSVRFYRTIILDEVNRDYVRTARAKGAPLPAVLFKHVLKNCMLPILTNLILSIPFLIMGSLLVETYFGIPGLGDLMLSSINGRDEPILSGLVFLTALIYTIGLLITDLSYAAFDPRIRLQ